MFIPVELLKNEAVTPPGDLTTDRLGADCLPDALLGELPIGAVQRLMDLDAASNHADECAHNDTHQQARWTRLELATRLCSGHYVREQQQHPLLDCLALGVEVGRVVMQLEEHERLPMVDGKFRHSHP